MGRIGVEKTGEWVYRGGNWHQRIVTFPLLEEIAPNGIRMVCRLTGKPRILPMESVQAAANALAKGTFEKDQDFSIS
jgi:hypothetical protein